MHHIILALVSVGFLAISAGQSASATEKLVTLPGTSEDHPGQPSQSRFEDIRPSGPAITLQLSLGTLLHLPSPASTVFIADADVVDVQVKRGDSIFVFAKKPGVTAIYATDDKGNILLNKAIRVDGPVTIIRREKIASGGQPEQGPQVLEIPLQPAATSSTAPTSAAAPRGR